MKRLAQLIVAVMLLAAMFSFGWYMHGRREVRPIYTTLINSKPYPDCLLVIYNNSNTRAITFDIHLYGKPDERLMDNFTIPVAGNYEYACGLPDWMP